MGIEEENWNVPLKRPVCEPPIIDTKLVFSTGYVKLIIERDIVDPHHNFASAAEKGAKDGGFRREAELYPE